MLASFARWTGAITTAQAPGITRARRRAIGVPPPSFTDLLPWTDYLPDEQAFLLEDGVSRGAVFELTPTATEGRTEDFLLRQADALRSAVNGSFPELDDGEWVLQFFAQDDPRIDSVYDELATTSGPRCWRRRTRRTTCAACGRTWRTCLAPKACSSIPRSRASAFGDNADASAQPSTGARRISNPMAWAPPSN